MGEPRTEGGDTGQVLSLCSEDCLQFADLKKRCAVAYDAGDAQHPEKGSLGGSHQRRGRFVQREVPHPLTPVTDLSHLQFQSGDRNGEKEQAKLIPRRVQRRDWR